MVRRLSRSLPQLEHVIVVRSSQRSEDMLDDARFIGEADPESVEPATVGPNDLKLAMYTSGTAGRAKARHAQPQHPDPGAGKRLRASLPKTASGKIRKDLLRQEIRSLLKS